MNFQRSLARLASVGMLWAGAAASYAALVDGTGQVTGWGFTPFNNSGSFGNWGNGAPPLPSGINGVDTGNSGGGAWTEANNAAPIDYPNSPDYVPAPAAGNGEGFDNEFLGWRLVDGGTKIQILGITSVNPNTGTVSAGKRFHLGDVFLNVDGDDSSGVLGYEYALTGGKYTSNLNDTFHPADDNSGSWSHTMANGLYSLASMADVRGVTDEGGFGSNVLYPGIPGPNNPWAVRTGATQVANLEGAGFETATYNYGMVFGANEDNTWLLQWTFDVSLLGPNFDPSRLTLHWSVECGNDYVDTDPVVPEPASLALMGLGLASMGVLRRRSRRS